MALRDVNLIATDILERRYLLRHLFMWCGGLIAVVALMMGIYAYLARIFYAAKQHPSNGKNHSAVLTTAVTDETTKGQQELNIALQERAHLGALTAAQRPCSSVMAKLAETINDQTWLQQLALDAGRDRLARLKLAGSSVSHASLGDFIQRLSGDPMFRGVVLKSAQESETRISGGSLVQFQIECDIVGR